MTKTERDYFEALVKQVANNFNPSARFDLEEITGEWQEFYRKVFKLNPGSEVMMKYEGTLFDLVRR